MFISKYSCAYCIFQSQKFWKFIDFEIGDMSLFVDNSSKLSALFLYITIKDLKISVRFSISSARFLRHLRQFLFQHVDSVQIEYFLQRTAH